MEFQTDVHHVDQEGQAGVDIAAQHRLQAEAKKKKRAALREEELPLVASASPPLLAAAEGNGELGSGFMR